MPNRAEIQVVARELAAIADLSGAEGALIGGPIPDGAAGDSPRGAGDSTVVCVLHEGERRRDTS